MVRIVLIRAGSTDFDEQRRIRGTLDMPLSVEGKACVARIAEDLRDVGIETIYSSGCEAAAQTAAAIARTLSVKPRKIENLQNVNHGLWQGMLVDEVRRKHPKVFRQWQEEPERICPPEGEMLGEARQRVSAALKKVLRKHKKGIIGIVAPEPLAGLISSYLRYNTPDHPNHAANGQPGWELIDLEPRSLVTP